MRFAGLGLGDRVPDRVPDARTAWLYRYALAQAGKVEELFGLFDGYLARQGYIARGGQILDGEPLERHWSERQWRTIVPVRCPHNTHDKNTAIKKGEVPQDRADKPARRCRKDPDSRWTKKHGKSHYGCKNHVNVDRTHKLVRRCHVTDAAVHDSQAVDHLLMQGNTGSGVWADSACRSEEIEARRRDRKLKSHIHRKGKRGKPLTEQAKGSNRTKSSVQVRVGHILGAQANDMGGTLVRTIGLVRAKPAIGMKNLTYNMRRLGQLGRINPNPA